MADNYLQFSEVIPNLTEEEEAWLRSKLNSDAEYDDEEYRDFCWRFDAVGRQLWIYAEEYGNPDDVVELVQEYLRKFHPDKTWGIEYSYTCSKPRVGQFSGGYLLVSADEIYGPLGLLETADDEHLARPINR